MQKTSETLPLFSPQTFRDQTLSLSDRLAKISALLESVLDLKETKVALSSMQLPSLLTSDQVFLSGKMLRELTPQTLARTFGRFSKRLPTLMVTDLNNNCLIQSGFYPRIESGFTLSAILQDEVSQEYFLSERMIFLLQKKRKVNYKPRLVQLSKQVEQCDLTTPI